MQDVGVNFIACYRQQRQGALTALQSCTHFTHIALPLVALYKCYAFTVYLLSRPHNSQSRSRHIFCPAEYI